jgi:hypothetical protein
MLSRLCSVRGTGGGADAGLSYVAVACDVLAHVHATGPREGRLASEVLQQLDLAEGALSQDLLAEDVGDLLDGDTLARLVVCGRTARPRSVCVPPGALIALLAGVPDDAVGALAQLLCHIVPLVDDELLVEHLEHLAAGEVGHGGGGGAAAG